MRRRSIPIILLLVIVNSLGFSQSKPEYRSGHIQGIYYESADQGIDNPLLIVVPGFTQYNLSPEFIHLKNKFEEFGWSYIVLNPPEHGQDSVLSEGIYSWGENEPSVFLNVLDSLSVWKHRNIHLLGFSVGAKIVLEMSRSVHGKNISSVISVAAPVSTSDIDLLLSGDIAHPFESLSNSSPTRKRINLFQLLHLCFVDLPVSQIIHSNAPLCHIGEIRSPILFIHSTDDWLIRSIHSLQLYNEASGSQYKEIRFIRSYLHAESMLTEDSLPPAKEFYRLLREWISKGKTEVLQQQDGSGAAATEISTMSYPDQYHPSTGLWKTAANYAPRSFSFDAAISLSSQFQRYETLLNLRTGISINENFKMAGGIAVAKKDEGNSPKFEVYGSLYYPVGFLLCIRRVGYLHGIGSEDNRSIISIDAALSMIGFQVNYGTIENNLPSGNITFDLPLIANGSGSFLLGAGLDQGFGINRTSNSILRAYIQTGQRISFANTRLRMLVSVNTPIDKISSTVIVFGISINPGEYHIN